VMRMRPAVDDFAWELPELTHAEEEDHKVS
jgi:hypothetical protein